MKRAVFFDKTDGILDVDIRYIPDNVSTFELFTMNQGYSPAPGDTIYLMPGVNIPRSKLKDLALNQGVKIVRDAEKANVIITGKATSGKILQSAWYYTADASTVERYLDKLSVDDYYKEKLRTALASSESDVTYISYSTRVDILSEVRDATFTTSSRHYYHIHDEWKTLIDDCQNKRVYDESELLAMINGDDAITIDNVIYTQLSEMFKSSDKDNHIMAMEIMANSHYVESALYLLMLLEEYGNRIAESNTKNHVNFKSMVSYFGLRIREVDSLNPDDVSRKLISLGLLTTESLDILLKSRLFWFISNIARNKTFNVASIIPTSEVLAAIDSDYRAEIAINDDKDPCIESTTCLDDLSAPVLEEQVQEEARTEVITELESIMEESISNELPAPPEEIILDISEPILNTNLIEETNESTDIDWF